jgi:type I restriction enzyme S subunit
MPVSQKQPKIPQLRFPEFSGEWEGKKLGDIAERYNGLKSKTKKDFGSGSAYITYTQIFENSKIKIENFGKVKVGENENQNKAKYGDVFFTTSSETPLEVGMSSVLLDRKFHPYLNSFAFGIRPKSFEILNPEFAQFYFRADVFRNKMYKLAQGSTRFNISRVEFMIKSILLPCSDEQKKIAGFLGSVDEWIENLTAQKETLGSYKRGLMQKLFPAKGETTPALRFPEFSGDWEEKELGNFSDITTGKLNANAMVEAGEYRFFTCARDYFHIDQYSFDTEALLISGNGANVGYVHYYKGKFDAYQRIYVLDNFDEDILYVKSYLDKNLQRRILEERKEGNTPYIVKSALSEYKIPLPEPEEQKKIADFLSSVDTMIANKQAEIIAAKKWKRGLMQKMFV